MKPYVLAIAAVFLLALGTWWRYEPSPASQVIEPSQDKLQAYQWSQTPCWFYVYWSPGIVCGVLKTPMEEGSFELPVVIVRAESNEPQPEPLLYLQGGPGASAGLDRAGIEYWLDWIIHAGLQRDLVLMDPRGVGRSKPVLKCEAHDDYSREILTRNVPLEKELEGGRVLLEQCFAELKQEPTNFSAEHYGTQSSARDIVGLMNALNYEQWNLLGVSYGSRLALAVAQSPDVQENNRLRSLILDSVYPPERGGLMAWPREATEGLERFFDWCEARTHCRGDFDDVEGNFQRALKHLKDNPVTVETELWREGSTLHVVMNDHRFIAAVFSAIYQHHLWPEIPNAIEAALKEEAEGMAMLVESFVNNALSPQLSLPVFFAVDCRDNPVGSAEEYSRALDEYPQYARYLQYFWEYRGCLHFSPAPETNTVPTIESAPDVPTLLLAGALDPITPLQWAQELAEKWPETQLVVFPSTGHAVVGSDDCVHTHFKDFLDQPSERWRPECLD
ncbi:alpha/beta hydrolase [Marinimicrobium sp. ABcell2]|uniref:alpha/beta hydrolase n=1 Tax=Marinimicrobium sp. ABcell2 TaxID=3069751 RepID=UPI0027B2AFFB|nr:alpha/beta hydrolase [Marinimicrobium sp. ABcell2]MDQ2075506.1 alpha/beta hydrolase [Marinimicrobium sp. ABcell2]